MLLVRPGWPPASRPRAEQTLAVAAKLRPDFADAWINLGLARYSQGAVEDAKKCFVRALQAQPGHAAATSNLAALLRLTGGYDTAETRCCARPSRAIRRTPGRG